jgi:hypothetical protein
VSISAQNIGQHHRGRISTRLRVTLAVAGRDPGIDREQSDSGRDQRSHPQPPYPSRWRSQYWPAQPARPAAPAVGCTRHVFGDTIAAEHRGLLMNDGHVLLPSDQSIPQVLVNMSSSMTINSHSSQDPRGTLMTALSARDLTSQLQIQQLAGPLSI